MHQGKSYNITHIEGAAATDPEVKKVQVSKLVEQLTPVFAELMSASLKPVLEILKTQNKQISSLTD